MLWETALIFFLDVPKLPLVRFPRRTRLPGMFLSQWRLNLLNAHLCSLVETIALTPELWGELISRDVVTDSERDQIQVRIL